MMRALPLVLLSLFCLPGQLRSQATPEAAAEAFGAAVIAADWPKAARLMHPDALRQLRDFLTQVLDSPGAGEMTQQLFGVSSKAELLSTPDTVLFARLLDNMMKQQGLSGGLDGATIKALGHVSQTGDTILVVSRMTMSISGAQISIFELMPFLPYQGGYRGLLKADFTNLLTMLRVRYGQGS